ncbi:hypothetical protein ACH5RR_001773 [Cinchona calisaya]|uniref:Uncharacterized protein n=1 Tax=Cinchona calisaya TaxID=153742 RepID=A0ABD3B5K7_9GENT
MRRGSRKMWWVVVPCSRKKKSLKAELKMDIEEILKMKLATITEEKEEDPADHDQTSYEENGGIIATNYRSSCMTKKGKKIHLKVTKMGRLFMPHFSLKETYVLFMSGLACKGGLHALPRY